MKIKPVKINSKSMSNAILKKDFLFSWKMIITIILYMYKSVGKKFKMSKKNEN
jgi:hypothetical protein